MNVVVTQNVNEFHITVTQEGYSINVYPVIFSSVGANDFVKSVNNVLPDSEGNVEVPILESIDVTNGESYNLDFNFSDGTSIPIELVQSYRHVQTQNNNTWTIVHNLGYKPSVTTIDLDGTEIHGDIIYTNNNELTVTFSEQVKGEAYLN